MQPKRFSTLLFLFLSVTVYSQKNLVVNPEKPKPGEVVTFTYTPAGDIANTIKPVEAVVYTLGAKGQMADDIILKREGSKYSGSFKTDTAQSLAYLAFLSDKKFDNNYNEGYLVQLYDGDNVKKGSNFNASQFYQYYGSQVGVQSSNEKALQYMEKEFTLYPESKKTYLPSYLRLYNTVNKVQGTANIEKEIESALKNGLKDEADYSLVENLYALAKLPEQGKLITTLKKEKFPQGKWTINEYLQKFNTEQDVAKKELMLKEIRTKIQSDPNWKYLESNLPYFESSVPIAYITKKDWAQLPGAITKANLKDQSYLASALNNTAWEMQKANEDLPKAEELSRMAVTITKNNLHKPTTEKPIYFTKKQWDEQRQNIYGMYADTYGMVMYKMGDYKKGLPYAEEAALKIAKGMNADENNTYALLAEKTLPVKSYKKQLEQFVKDGKSTSEIKDILKRAYVKQNKSENGFEDYIAALEKESYLQMVAELRKSILNEAVPSFALLDLDGNNVNISDLKNKVVVVDFWATWCGPCKASFPAMQKMVDKFKDDPGVKFVFVDTWERGENKKKDAADFLAAHKYTFHVLQDVDDKVVSQFNVNGIPTKFVIDKNGMIRFKAIGFDGSDEKLVSELSAMIELANDPSKKM